MKKSAVAFTEHPYDYEDKGGTRVSAEKLGVDERLARQIGKKRERAVQAGGGRASLGLPAKAVDVALEK